LYNKPKAEVHPRHKLTGPEEEEEEEGGGEGGGEEEVVTVTVSEPICCVTDVQNNSNMTSVSQHDKNEVLVLLGCYTALIGR
jgi:hypothetical protein